jgi:tetratricopeptide (TPR) repeat protein
MKCELDMGRETLRRIILNCFKIFFLFFIGASVTYGHGSDDEVIRSLTREIKNKPNESGLYFIRAETYSSHGDFNLALKDYEKSQKLNVKQEGIEFGIAKVFFKRKMFKKSLQVIEDYQRRNLALDTETLLLKSRTLRELKKWKESTEAYHQVVRQIKNYSADILCERAETQLMLGNDQLDSIISDLDIENVKYHDDVLTEIIIGYEIKRKNWTKAIERYRILLSGKQRKESFYIKIAQIYELAQSPIEAVMYYHKAKEEIAQLPEHLKKTQMIVEMLSLIDLKTTNLK